MNKRSLLSLALATLIVPQAFGMLSDSSNENTKRMSKYEEKKIAEMFQELHSNPSYLFCPKGFSWTIQRFI